MHAAQLRKQDKEDPNPPKIPYIAHPLAVSSIVLEHRGDEDTAIAGLLHDLLEDYPDTAASSAVVKGFGPEVERIVLACTDGLPDVTGVKAPWRERKEGYLRHLDTADAKVLLVAGADKLHNTRSMVADYRRVGEALWRRFNASRDDILWYHDALVERMGTNSAHDPDLVGELARTVQDLHRLVDDARIGSDGK
jgi:(p)ppGpp synthase/HD superfamily hydrolase